MTAEQNFIKKLEAYLDCEINDYGKRRIEGYLRDYAAEVPQIKKIEFPKDDYIYIKKEANDLTLYSEAQRLCEANLISVFDFLNPKNGKSTNLVAEVRKVFCKEMLNRYKISIKELKEFFGVDHSTISHYIHGKKYKQINRSNTTGSQVNS